LPARRLRTLFSSKGKRGNVTAKQNRSFIIPMQPHETLIAELE
jgi:hypothetical protein